MISNRTTKLINSSCNWESIYDEVFDPGDILNVFHSINASVRYDINNSSTINVLFPWNKMLYSHTCDQRVCSYIPGRKCLGCVLLSRLNPSGIIDNQESFIITENTNNSKYLIEIFNCPNLSGWKKTESVDDNGKELWKTDNKAEQYILSCLSIESHIVGFYFCKDRFVVIARDDKSTVAEIDNKGVEYQLRERLKGLSTVMYTHGQPDINHISIYDEPYVNGDLYYPFTVNIIPTDKDTICVECPKCVRLCRTSSDIPPIDENEKFAYDRSFDGAIDKIGRWEYDLFMKSLNKSYSDLISFYIW